MSRPFALDLIFLSVQTLPGVGPRSVKLYEKIAGPKIVDLMWHLPVGIIDRRYNPEIAKAESGRIATLTVKVIEHVPAPVKNKPYRVRCGDKTGVIDLIFFHPRKGWLEQQLPVGETRIISGKVEYFHGLCQMSHPDAIGLEEERALLQTVEPVYGLTAGLNHKPVLKAVRAAIPQAPKLNEWIDAAHLKREGWDTWQDALIAAHNPDGEQDLDPTSKPRMRLAYDELLANQLAINLVRLNQRKLNGRVLKCDEALYQKTLDALPFTLTDGQNQSIAEIREDMADEGRMLRLLQGDVGSGKTIVAFFAMLNAVGSGAQAAIMAPTSILAQQHAANIIPLAEKIGFKAAVLTGRDKGKPREALLEQIAKGDIDIVIGTHALFQDDVIFKDLGMAVIDEQHRFGVHQRLKLSGKGSGTDILVMTATPIPRTLTLTAYGDMETSRLSEKPKGRQAIETVLVSNDRIQEVVLAIQRKVSTGARVYWVCPLVEESETLDLAAAEDRHLALEAIFGTRVGLVHGRMKSDEKDAVMDKFSKGEIDVLVATTVIEVGVDVPEATVIVIEHAERFGLSQLHQLRGRVGRGDAKSSCILLYATRLGAIAKQRLKIIRDTEDGFLIAEEDLKLRGAGELLGTRQSGAPEFRLADTTVHGDLLKTARDDAKLILGTDPGLTSKRGNALRTLLYLFERDHAIKLLRSG